MKQKGFIPLLVLIVIVVVGSIGSFIYFKQTKVAQPSSSVVTKPVQTASSSAVPTVSNQPLPSLKPVKTSPPTPVVTPVTTPAPAQQNSRSSVKLESISPAAANSGDEIRLIGSGFGTIMGKVILYNQILGPNTPFMTITPNRWTDTEIKITIPPAVGGQDINTEVQHPDGTKSNRVSFHINGGQPRISSISPSNAQPLQQIALSGNEFGNQAGSVDIFSTNNVDLSNPNTKCEASSWSNSQISCKLPSNVNNGQEYGIRVVSSDGRGSSMSYYKVGN